MIGFENGGRKQLYFAKRRIAMEKKNKSFLHGVHTFSHTGII
jgi:hypothetical protein